jgi:hypothetical protein
MHIEKNVMDNILGTILDIKGKTEDGRRPYSQNRLGGNGFET